jgi:hypothetical protein
MKRMYAVFLFVVATYFLLAPEGVSKRPSEASLPKPTKTGPA